MLDQFLQIINNVFESFVHIWPYLLITIPISVAINVAGISKHINTVLRKSPKTAILMATIVGAFSPFCSCGVIPVIAALLIGGVPIAPVMSFWIASPSMDPEIFFLSVGMLGWQLAIWRLASTLVLSLGAGFLTHYLIKLNWLAGEIGWNNNSKLSSAFKNNVKSLLRRIKGLSLNKIIPSTRDTGLIFEFAKATDAQTVDSDFKIDSSCGCNSFQEIETKTEEVIVNSCGCNNTPKKEAGQVTKEISSCGCNGSANTPSFRQKIVKETWNASYMIFKFMGIAFLIKALITLYVPNELVTQYMGSENVFSILFASLIGIPFYTSNLAALPLVSGFMQQGMSGGAALAFLIAGPVTTLPAMSAVWGITNKKIFLLYVLIPLVGSVVFGYLYNFINLF